MPRTHSDNPEGLTAMLTGMVSGFPQATKLAFSTTKSAHEKFEKLSPESKETLSTAAAASVDAARKSYSWLKRIYSVVMKWGTIKLDRWHQPPAFLLRLLSSTILFILPVDDVWMTMDLPKGKVVYAGNQNLYGIDTLSTLSIIFSKTGVLPRVILEPMHFKIPVWKHLIEYMGAVSCEHPGAIEYLMSLEYPLLVYPGGRREFFRKKRDEKYSLEWRHIELRTRVIDDLNTFAPKHEYLVVPVASIGVNDMLNIMCDCSWNPYNLMRTIPLACPISYQRQYLTLLMPIRLHDGKYDDVFVQEELERGIVSTLSRRQSAGERRILLRRVSKTLGVVFAKDGAVMTSSRFIFGIVQAQAMSIIGYLLEQLQISEDIHHGRDGHHADEVRTDPSKCAPFPSTDSNQREITGPSHGSTSPPHIEDHRPIHRIFNFLGLSKLERK
ncbi:hypothetical protein BSLG_004173 [Batrachochytrium salamandrivorans]|nr:hypothetical protein BASA83_011119 [Batrachochytrium salamandrivorans]KAJ1341238.1 hypothetical protein BSLG_004173 [Batrachochytrium salamandrivorans]